MVSFRIKGGLKEAQKFMKAIKVSIGLTVYRAVISWVSNSEQ
jgi:hypothetical protein